MKYILKSIVLLLGVLVISCEQGIDPITAVAAGADQTAPQVTITYPTEGTDIQAFEEVSSIHAAFQVTDDLEVSKLRVLMHRAHIDQFSSFPDYRIVIKEVTFNGLVNGAHTVTVIATDVEGKTTTQEVN